MRVDLHTHTTASDGQYAPAELVAKAREAGIELLAVTDHDTLGGTDEAVHAGVQQGIRVLRGVELSAAEDRHLHLLGLAFGPDCAPIQNLCRRLQQGRHDRTYRIQEYLREKGMDIPLEEVEAMAAGGVIGRPHFAQVMVQRGYVSSFREAFDRYLDTDEYQKIERFKPAAADCIAAIHEAGGKAVLAHPYQLNFSEKHLDAFLSNLRSLGLDGLECYYPRHTEVQVRQYLNLAEKHGLHVTAGSDFHGEAARPDTVLQGVALDAGWLLDQ